MKDDQTRFDAFSKRIKPNIRLFYRAAYAITADRQMAEQVLTEALVKAYLKGVTSASVGMRDAVIALVRASAFEKLDGETSLDDWPGFEGEQDKKDALIRLIRSQETDVQRFRARAENDMKKTGEAGRGFERMCVRSVRQQMNAAGEDRIDVDFLLRQAESEIAGRQRPRRIISRAVRVALFIAFGLLCALVLWAVAVLLLI